MSGNWWVVAAVCGALVVTLLGSFVLAANLDVRRGPGIYELRDALKDTADVALKSGAVIAGLIGMYRYWYQRYEPLVYYTSCGKINRHLLANIQRQAPPPPIGLPRGLRTEAEAQAWHNAPLIVLHGHTMKLLHLKDSMQVDCEFTKPGGERIWAVAFAYAFPASWDDEQRPIGLSKSLGNFFGIERDHPGITTPHDTATTPPPHSNEWQDVEVNDRNYWRISQSEPNGRLIWLVSTQYSVRFRDHHCLSEVHRTDAFDSRPGRAIEYSGISLRVYRRNALRYRGGH